MFRANIYGPLDTGIVIYYTTLPVEVLKTTKSLFEPPFGVLMYVVRTPSRPIARRKARGRLPIRHN